MLIKAEPVTIFGENDQEYMENFSPVELFEFLNYSMKSYDLTEEEDLLEFMEIQSDSMEINGEVYSGTNAVDTSNKGKLTFDNIDFDTKIDESGVWIRTIELSVPEEQADIMFSELSRRCERCDASFESSGGTCTVVLSAETEKNLIEKMLTILQTDVNIRHYRYYQENGTVRNETEETINVDSILAEEGDSAIDLNFRMDMRICRHRGMCRRKILQEIQMKPEILKTQRLMEILYLIVGKRGK